MNSIAPTTLRWTPSRPGSNPRMAGNYDHFSRYMESSAVQFLDRLEVPAGSSVLDVACGSGQLGMIASAPRSAGVGCDIAANSDRRRPRARASGRARGAVRRGRCRGAALCGWPVRPRGVDLRRDVRPAARPGRERTAPRLEAGRLHRDGELTREAVHRPDVPDDQQAHRAAGQCCRRCLWGDEATVRERFGTGAFRRCG